MKYFCSLALITLCLASAPLQDPKSVFTSTDIVWFGLDFTHARFVAFDQTGNTASDLKYKMMPAWNNLFVTEQPKYDLRKTFRKDNVRFDLNGINGLNAKVDVDSIMVYNPVTIDRVTIDNMIKKYTGEMKTGIGLSFIIENFNKGTQTADLYVTFFDIATKKVLLCEKMSGRAVGVGLRNYWAGAIKAILKRIDEMEYKNWKAKY